MSHRASISTSRFFQSRNTSKCLSSKPGGLSFRELLSCTREPWENAFSEENNRKAWEACGIRPFDRRVYWSLKKKEDTAKAKAAAAALSFYLVSAEERARTKYNSIVPPIPLDAEATDAKINRRQLASVLFNAAGGAVNFDEGKRLLEADRIAREKEADTKSKMRKVKAEKKHAKQQAKAKGALGILSKLASGNGVSDIAGLKAVEADTLMSYFCYTEEGSEGLKDNFDLENLKKSWPSHKAAKLQQIVAPTAAWFSVHPHGENHSI